MIAVPGCGRAPCDWMICGEGPGEVEARLGKPFVGRSGDEQNAYLSRHGLHSSHFYLTNVVKEYIPGNPDPTPAQIEQWTPVLEEEISRVQPKVILAVGRFAARWFIGDELDMDAAHGMPHRGGEIDKRYSGRAAGAIVVPCYHPAFGFYSPDAKTLIDWDYAQAAAVIKAVKSGQVERVRFRIDEWAGHENYQNVSGAQLHMALLAHETLRHPIAELAIDTEGTPDNPWSIQVSATPGSAWVLRRSDPHFHIGVAALQRYVDRGTLITTHDAGTPMGCLYDTIMCRAMGLELTDAHMWNTMYAAYLLRIEPKGLKALMYRWCGMVGEDYQATIGNIGRAKAIDYLTHAATIDWGKVEPHVEIGNDGSIKLKKPKPINTRISGCLADIAKGKVNKDGELRDPYKWWRLPDNKWMRVVVEEKLGPMPHATLDDVDLEQAVFYGGHDSDGSLRLARELRPQLKRMGLDGLMATGMEVLPVLEEMQRVGMPASRSRFMRLKSRIEAEMVTLQSQLSARYFEGRSFNPGSSLQVAELLDLHGLKAAKTTSTGAVSTSKKSIEHLALGESGHPAIRMLFDWRERQKILSTYIGPALEESDRQGGEKFTVHCNIKPVTVATRRLSAADPNLLNQPKRTKLGVEVRGCYVTEPPEVFCAWDYNSQEMRVAAHVSGDRLLCKLFVEGRDPHKEAAARIFGVPVDQVDKDTQRLPTKTANFGILYGLSGAGLQELFHTFGLVWELDRCQELIDEILKKVYPGLSASIRDIQSETKRTGMVRDLYGMVRYLPGIWSRSYKESSEAGRQAFSHVIQGTAQGMIQNAMAWLRGEIRGLQRLGLDVRWALQIHDELMLRADVSLWEVLDGVMREGMVEHCGLRLKVPVIVEGKFASSWGELK